VDLGRLLDQFRYAPPLWGRPAWRYPWSRAAGAALLVREDLRRQRTGLLQMTRWALAQYGNGCGRHRIMTAGKRQLAPLLMR